MTHKVSTGKGEWLFVEVPENACAFRITDTNPSRLFYVYGSNWNGGDKSTLPPGSYTFIGTTKDISEEQAAGIIDGYIYSGKSSYQAYKDYLGKKPQSEDDIITDPTESLRSLLIANQLNPELNFAILKLTNG